MSNPSPKRPRRTVTTPEANNMALRTPTAPVSPARVCSAAADAQSKFAHVRDRLDAALIERTGEIDAVLVCLIARSNSLLVGRPGLGKSLLCDGLLEALDGDVKRFDYLFRKDSTPEDVFGMFDLRGLEHGRYERLTEGYLPTAHVAFLDEIFKAGPASLNPLLKVLNEKKFRNGTTVHKCPLMTAMACSNEWPQNEGVQELAAFFDRFLVRVTVRKIGSEEGKRRLLFGGPITFSFDHKLTLADVASAQKAAATLPFADGAQEALLEIVTRLDKDEKVEPSDRRLAQSVLALQANAFLNGRDAVTTEDMDVLVNVLWDNPVEEPAKVAKVVAKVANPAALAVNAVLAQINDICLEADAAVRADSGASRRADSDVGDRGKAALTVLATAVSKLKVVQAELTKMKSTDPRVRKAHDYAAKQIKRLMMASLGGAAGRME